MLWNIIWLKCFDLYIQVKQAETPLTNFASQEWNIYVTRVNLFCRTELLSFTSKVYTHLQEF